MRTSIQRSWLMIAASAWLAQAETLDDWLREAASGNPALAAAVRSAEAARARVGMAGALMDPMIGVKAMRADSTDPADYSMLEWMVEQTVPGPGKRGARAAASVAAADAADAETLDRLDGLRERVVSAYWDLWLMQRRAALMGEALDWMGQAVDAARARYATPAGMGEMSAGASDVLRAEIEQARMRNALETMRREVQTAQSAVNALLNAPPDHPRDALSMIVEPANLPLDPTDLLAQAEERGATLRAARERIRAARASAQAARIESRPDFRFLVEARQPKDGGAITEYDTAIGFTFPWLWSGKYEAARRETGAMQAMAEADYTAMRNDMAVMIRELCARAETARRTIRLHEDEIGPKSRQLVVASLAAYRTARADFMTVVEGLRTEIQARTEYADARAGLGRAEAGLQRIAGGVSRGAAGRGAGR